MESTLFILHMISLKHFKKGNGQKVVAAIHTFILFVLKAEYPQLKATPFFSSVTRHLSVPTVTRAESGG